MGRIKNEELYILDQAVSGNDRLIGSDGDDLKKTKNFSVDDLIAYFQANNPGGIVGIGTQDEGVSVLASSTILNFIGAAVTATDGGVGVTDITIVNDTQFSVVTPIDSYFGTKYTPLAPASGGLYINGSGNKATGILIDVPNNAGNLTWGGFSFIQGGVAYETGGDFILYSNDYFEEELRNNMGFYFTSDFYITGSRNTSNILIRLGTTAQSYNTQSLQETVFEIKDTREITANALTIALIDGEATGKSITTREWVEGQGFLSRAGVISTAPISATPITFTSAPRLTLGNVLQ